MVKCPKCGKEVPKNNWTMTGKPDETGKTTDVTFGMCEDCSLIMVVNLKKSARQKRLIYQHFKIGFAFMYEKNSNFVYS